MGVDHMESSAIVVFSCVAGVILLVSLLMSGVLWARLSAVDDRQEALAREMVKESTPKQLEKALAVSEGTRDRVDNALLEMSKFKDQIHAEVQRYYAIMRRQEKASAFGQASTPTSAETETAPPDEVSADILKKNQETPERESKADLRARARAAGL